MNELTRVAKLKVLNGEELRASSVRVRITDIRPPWATVLFETVDANDEVLSEMGRMTVREGDSVTIAEIDRAFTFTLA